VLSPGQVGWHLYLLHACSWQVLYSLCAHSPWHKCGKLVCFCYVWTFSIEKENEVLSEVDITKFALLYLKKKKLIKRTWVFLGRILNFWYVHGVLLIGNVYIYTMQCTCSRTALNGVVADKHVEW
jgi:hypothetical protein